MFLTVIGPERAAPVLVVLAQDPEATIDRARREWLGGEGLVLHRKHELPRGFDNLALTIVDRALRAYAAGHVPNSYRVKPSAALLQVDFALRAIEGLRDPPERPSRGEFVREFRERVLGTTQAVLATIAGVSEPTVSRWERGDLSPDFYALFRMRSFARTAGLPWDDARVFADG